MYAILVTYQMLSQQTLMGEISTVYAFMLATLNSKQNLTYAANVFT